MSTADNLKEAFAGESQANRKYLAFAKKAEAEGFKQVAKLFRAASAAETFHAHAHLRVMGGVKGTADNLQVAKDGEGYEFQQMYPKFVAEAKAEGNTAAVTSFEYAMAVEKVHYNLYDKALQAVTGGKDLPAEAIYICPVCGNTFVGTLPEKCEICGVTKDKFSPVK